jgi:choline dehydrogenase
MASSADYDYIVIGAGAAGSIVAAEAAAAGYSVLLLDMGRAALATEQNVWDPARWNLVLADPDYEIGFKSAPQAGLGGRTQNLLQSRGLGGCQLHNAMVYVRGGRSTYDHWAGALGCTGWDYASLAPLFAAIEAKLGVVTAPTDPFAQSFLDAGRRLGLPLNPNYNQGPTEYGAVPFQFTIEDAGNGALKRTTSFLKYVGEAPPANLFVATQSTVVSLILGGSSPGVSYFNARGTPSTAFAGREIILAAGAIMSPTILLRSGLGPADALRAREIAVAADLPAVGENFHDDLGVGIPVVAQGSFPPQPYGYIGAGLFASDSGQAPPDPAPFGAVNLELQFSTSELPGAPGLDGARLCFIGCSAMHLASAGTVRLDPANPMVAPPVIDPGWLSQPADMARCVAALELTVDVATEPTLAAIWQWAPLAVPEPGGYEDYVRMTGLTLQHYVGSCRMGTDPATSVVGPDLKVHGVDGLRVIDASIAPTTVTGNTAGVSMMIGAKGAQLLLGG